MRPAPNRLALVDGLSYATIVFVWGSTFLAIAYAIQAFTPFGLSAFRFLPAGLIALALGRLRGESLPTWGDLPHLAFVGVLLLTVCMAIIAWAERTVPSGLAAVTGATVPLFLGVLAPAGIGRRGALGLLLGFAGAWLLLAPSGGAFLSKGHLALLASAALWSYGTLHGKRHATTGGHFTQVAVEMLSAGILAASLAPFTGGFIRAPLKPAPILALGYLVVFGSVLAYSAYIHLARVWTPARLGTYAYLNPLVALLLGWWLRGEVVHLRTLPALALVLLGVFLLQWPRRPAPSTATS